MGLRVNTNIASLTAQRNLTTVTGRLGGNYSRLSSGLRIATAADDAAGLAISERMRSQIRSYGAAARNVRQRFSAATAGARHRGDQEAHEVEVRDLAIYDTLLQHGSLNLEFREIA